MNLCRWKGWHRLSGGERAHITFSYRRNEVWKGFPTRMRQIRKTLPCLSFRKWEEKAEYATELMASKEKVLAFSLLTDPQLPGKGQCPCFPPVDGADHLISVPPTFYLLRMSASHIWNENHSSKVNITTTSQVLLKLSWKLFGYTVVLSLSTGRKWRAMVRGGGSALRG